MPKNPVAVDNMSKNLTPAERLARQNAEQQLQRKKVSLRMPDYLKADPVAAAYWKKTIELMKSITLLDDLDSDMLGVYCSGLSRLDMLRVDAVEARERGDFVIKRTIDKALNGEYADQDYPAKVIRACLTNEADVIRLMQAQERLTITYAEKLGLTPSGRVRLAKKRAEENPVDPNRGLFGD